MTVRRAQTSPVIPTPVYPPVSLSPPLSPSGSPSLRLWVPPTFPSLPWGLCHGGAPVNPCFVCEPPSDSVLTPWVEHESVPGVLLPRVVRAVTRVRQPLRVLLRPHRAPIQVHQVQLGTASLFSLPQCGLRVSSLRVTLQELGEGRGGEYKVENTPTLRGKDSVLQGMSRLVSGGSTPRRQEWSLPLRRLRVPILVLPLPVREPHAHRLVVVVAPKVRLRMPPPPPGAEDSQPASFRVRRGVAGRSGRGRGLAQIGGVRPVEVRVRRSAGGAVGVGGIGPGMKRFWVGTGAGGRGSGEGIEVGN